jgi:hypothetical protein
MRQLHLFGLILLASCGPLPSNHGLSDKHPYGEWSSGHGQTVVVRRDGTYTFCYGAFCEEGNHVPEGRTSVDLLGFGSMKSTARLRKISQWDEYGRSSAWADDPVKGQLYTLGQTGQPQSMTDEICGGRPCSRIGSVNGTEYAFSKMRDY